MSSSLKEDLNTNTKFAEIEALDPEQNGIAYSISGNDKDKVSVSESGNIILSKSLDYEDKRELQFVLEVFDGKNTVSTPVNIKIENVNELQIPKSFSPTVHGGVR